ncbi:MAG: hypothetical protein ACO3A4_11185 [Silvanigrellaceae bacterium]
MSARLQIWISRICAAVLLSFTPSCINEGSETIGGSEPFPEANRLGGNGGRTKPVGPRGAAATEVDDLPAQVAPETGTSGTINRQLLSWYSVKSNYDLVYRDVLGFYPEGRYNGCVAFLSAALRRIGVSVPIQGSSESVSLVTKPFSNHLEKNLGWLRISSANLLQPGDVVFTTDNPSYPGYPAHTYVFHSWTNKILGLAMVIDNQEFTHERNIHSKTSGYNFTPFSYALRSR